MNESRHVYQLLVNSGFLLKNSWSTSCSSGNVTQYEDKIFGVRIIHSQSTSIRPREETTFEDLITFDEEDDNGLKCKYKFTAKQKRRRRIISLDHTSIHWHCCQGVSLGPYEGKVFVSYYCQKFQKKI